MIDDKPRILIAGLGNELLMDDGMGVHAARLLAQDPPAGAVIAEVGTAILSALHLLEEADIILAIDAVEAGGHPGDIYLFSADDAERLNQPLSLHQFSLTSAYRLIPETKIPPIWILGVEPERVDYGMELSPTVAASLSSVVLHARRIAKQWREGKGCCDERMQTMEDGALASSVAG